MRRGLWLCLLAVAGLAFAVAVAAPFAAQDRCLDGGGAWDAGRAVCVGAPIDLSEELSALGQGAGSTTFVARRLSDGRLWSAGSDRAEVRFPPASTAKIPHTLLALEAGIAEPETLFVWDGEPKGPVRWNRDHTLTSAFGNSAVWVFQEITQALGEEAIAQGLVRFAYGNERVGPSDAEVPYWLDGTLLISATEQVAFLGRLAGGTLPIDTETTRAATGIMQADAGEGWRLFAKSGWWHDPGQMDIGWYVGWVDCAGTVTAFALNLDMPDTRWLHRREMIARDLLARAGAFRCD